MCANPVKRMLVKQVIGKKEHVRHYEREFSMLSALATKVAISPFPFFVEHRKGANYVFMEYIKGTALSTVRPKTWPMFQLVVAQILLQITELHRNNIVHRDLKPNQWMLSPPECAQWYAEGNFEDFIGKLCKVVLLDFDFACIARGAARNESTSKLTCDGRVLGSYSYLPPEMNHHEIDEAYRGQRVGDIWSFGASILMAPLEATFGQRSLMEFVQDDWRILKDLGLPEWLKRLVKRTIRVQPATRPQAFELFSKFAYGEEAPIPELVAMLGLGAAAGAEQEPKAARDYPVAFEQAKERLRTALGSELGPQNAFQLYAVLVERQRFLETDPLRDWVKLFGNEWLEKGLASEYDGYRITVPSGHHAMPKAEAVLGMMGRAPLRMELVGVAGYATDFNGVKPIVDVDEGSYPVVAEQVHEGQEQHLEALQALTKQGAISPLPYFSLERRSEPWLFSEYLGGTPLNSLAEPTRNGTWEVAELIVAQMLLQFARLQDASLLHGDLQLERWELHPPECVDFYTKGKPWNFVDKWCRVTLLGTDHVCRLRGEAQATGLAPGHSAGDPKEELPPCDRRRDPAADVRPFGEAIVGIFGASAYKAGLSDDEWTRFEWPSPIRVALDKTLSPEPGARAQLLDMFKTYTYPLGRKSRGGFSLAGMLQLLGTKDAPCMACLEWLGAHSPWIATEVPAEIRNGARRDLKAMMQQEVRAVNAFQLYAMVVERHYTVDRHRALVAMQDLRQKMSNDGKPRSLLASSSTKPGQP